MCTCVYSCTYYCMLPQANINAWEKPCTNSASSRDIGCHQEGWNDFYFNLDIV